MVKWMTEDHFALSYNYIKKMILHIKNIENNTLEQNKIDFYQNNLIKKSIPNMFLMKKLPIEPIEQEAKIDSGLIRNILFINLLKIFKNTKTKIKNNDDFNNIIHSEDLYNEFINTILNMFQTYIKTEIDKFPFSEIFITYLAELKKLASMFIRELHDNYSRDKLIDFSDKHAINEKFELILKKSLEYIITNKSNIYYNISYKKILLNY